MNNIMLVSPKEAAQCVLAALETKTPVMIWGPPGTAKSAVVRQVAEEHGLEFIDLRLVQIDALDLRGMPYKETDSEGRVVMSFAPTSILPRSGKGILFLDELPQAPTLVQNAASELLLDRRIGEYHLPDGWVVIAAGNRRKDRAGTLEVPSHIKNRVIHVEMKTAANDWLEWASQNGIHPMVIAFLKSSPERLYAFEPDQLAFPTLRSWEFASRVLKSSVTGRARDAMIYGCVGEAVGTQLCVFIERQIELPSYEDVIADPSGVKIPKALNMGFALAGIVGSHATEKHAPQVVTFLKRYTPEEARFVLASMFEANPSMMKVEEYKKLNKELSGKAKAA